MRHIARQPPIRQGHIWAEPEHTEEQRHVLDVQKRISQTKSSVALVLVCTHEGGQPQLHWHDSPTQVTLKSDIGKQDLAATDMEQILNSWDAHLAASGKHEKFGVDDKTSEVSRAAAQACGAQVLRTTSQRCTGSISLQSSLFSPAPHSTAAPAIHS